MLISSENFKPLIEKLNATETIVNFFDPDGNLIEAVDSADQEGSAETEEMGDYANTGDINY